MFIYSLLIFSQDFIEAKQAISFFIYLEYYIDRRVPPYHLQPLSLENIHTKETLLIKPIADHHATISRHPTGTSEAWIEEMAKYEENNGYRTITIGISFPLIDDRDRHIYNEISALNF